MMSLGVIKKMSDDAARKAKRGGETPYAFWDNKEIDEVRTFPFPFLGTYVPKGWEVLDQTWFVDSSGLGAPYESALTQKQFRNALKDFLAENPRRHIGFALTEVGNFQVYVAAYERKS